MSKALALVLAACAAPAPRSPDDGRAPSLRVQTAGVGPIDADTPATLRALRQRLPGYVVVAVNRGGLEYHVVRGGEDLLFVVADDQTGTVFNVHVTSPRVAVAEHDGWRVGLPFPDAAALSTCECWGDEPVCYERGDRVGVQFDGPCVGSDFKKLAGAPIAKLVWTAKPFEHDRD